MTEDGPIEKLLLITYTLSADFAVRYGLTQDFTDFSGTIQFEDLSNGLDGPCISDPDPDPVPVNPRGGGSGSGGGGGGGAGGSGSGGEGGSSGGSSGTPEPIMIDVPDNPGRVPVQAIRYESIGIAPITVPIVATPLYPGSLYPPYSGGGGSPINFPTNPLGRVTMTALNVPGIVGADDPCFDPILIGILEPVNPEKEFGKNCEELNKQTVNIKVDSALKDLKIKAELTDGEYGYSISKNPNYTAQEIPVTAPYFPISQIGVTTPFPAANLNVIGVIHTHPNDYQGYLMFSPQDFTYFYEIAKRHKTPPGQNKNPNEYTLMVVSNQGVYAMKIEDSVKFLAAMQHFNQKSIDNLEAAYRNRMPMDPITFFEKDILKFIASENLGVSIYKAESDLSNWSKLELNDNSNSNDGDDINYIPCI